MELLDCHECGDTFSDLKKYFLHKVLHNNLPLRVNDNIVKLKEWNCCPMCPKRSTSTKTACKTLYNMFAKTLEMNGFRLIFYDLKEHECKYCQKFFLHLRDLNKHLITHDPNRKPYCCDICNKTFIKEINFKQHYVHLHKIGIEYKCNHCPKVFVTEKGRKMHELTHTNSWIGRKKEKKKQNVDCPQCHKTFSRSQYYKRHKERIHDSVGNRFACDLCPNTFPVIYDLNRHKKVHTEDCFKCTQCEKKYCTKYEFDRHMERNHKSIRSLYVCDMCPKGFTVESNLTYHKTTHENDNILEMNETNKSKDNFNRTKNQFQCEICTKILVSEKNLNRHKEGVHKSKTIFDCPHCSSKFFKKYSLVLHIRSKHSADNTFKCVTCNEGFEEKTLLMEHRNRVHNDNYPCAYCSEVFPRKIVLRRHIDTVHSDIRNIFNRKLRQCLKCKVKFSSLQFYEEHIERIHKVIL